MKLVLFILFLLFIICCQQTQINKLQHVSVTPKTSIVFADSALAAQIVSKEDDYTKVLSAYDRSAAIQSATPVSKEDYLVHLAKNVMNWPEEQVKRFTSFSEKISPRLQELNLNLPEKIILIKTTSQEVGGASPAYTRQNAIMFTAPMLNNTDSLLANVLLHEIAHVYSRHNKDKRNQLYNILGFRETNDIKLPAEWDKRRISNPDAPALNTIIEIQHDQKTIFLTPLTYARVPVYDTTKAGGIFQSFGFQMMEVIQKNEEWIPLFFDGNPVLYNPNDLPDFFNKIGKNTNYIIHPEEIMASNFVHLFNKKSGLPNPEIIEKMKVVLSQNGN